MFKTTDITVDKYLRLPLAAALGLSLSACDPDNSSILDLDGLFPVDAVTQTLPETQTGTNTGDNGSGTETTGTGTGTSTNINSPTATFELSANQIPIELALLTEGEIVTESRFNGAGDPIQDRFSLPASGYELTPDGEFAALRHESGNTVTVCSYVFQTAQYLCLRAFDLDINDRVWHLFSMQSNSDGSGVFEFCTIENTTDACLDKLIENPDGTATVTINRAGAFAQVPSASPYFAYENQATTLSNRSTNVALSDYYVDTMNALLTAAVGETD